MFKDQTFTWILFALTFTLFVLWCFKQQKKIWCKNLNYANTTLFFTTLPDGRILWQNDKYLLFYVSVSVLKQKNNLDSDIAQNVNRWIFFDRESNQVLHKTLCCNYFLPFDYNNYKVLWQNAT